jgi:O-antigen/teichoic acid export membrane protein
MTLRQQLFSGVLWTGLATGLSQLLAVGASILLARLLTPDDFALLAIAQIFVTFSITLGEFGFGTALIQWQGEIEPAANVAFVFNLLLSLAMALILFFAAPIVALFYEAPAVTWVVRAMAVNVLLTAGGVVAGSLLERRLDFRRRTVADMASQLVYVFVAVPLAWAGQGVWSLVAGTVLSTAVRSLILWREAKFTPRWRFDREVSRRLFKFGLQVVLIFLLLFAINKLDLLYLGKITTLREVGYYSMALGIVTLTVDLITSLAARVLFPAFSQWQDNLPQVGRAYLHATRLTSYATFPLIFGIMAVAPAGIVSVYGVQWEPVVALARILCFFALFRAMGRLTGNVLTATGRPDLTTRLAIIRLVFLVAALLSLGILWQTPGVAWAVSLATAASTLWSLWITHRYLSISTSRYWSTIRSQLTAAVVMAVVVTLIGQRLPLTLLALVGLVLVGLFCYAGLLLLIDRARVLRDIEELWRLVRERMRPGKEVAV